MSPEAHPLEETLALTKRFTASLDFLQHTTDWTTTYTTPRHSTDKTGACQAELT